MMVESKVYSFSNDGGSAIQRQVHVHETPLGRVDLETFFEVPRCVEWILVNSFKKVCLQFPDELLSHSVAVSQKLEQVTGQRMHILADSTYGSCCVDEKTAKHVSADSIIHFGLSCLSATTQRLPVLLVFTQPEVDLSEAEAIFRKTFEPEAEVVILFDVIYESAAKELFQALKGIYPRMLLSELVIPGSLTCSEPGLVIHSRRIGVSGVENVEKVFYIGSNEKTLLNFLLHFSLAEFLLFDPKTLQSEERNSHLMKLLMRRNYYVEKLKDASSVGILVGTLAVDSYLTIIAQIKETLRRAGKRFYIVSIGEITPPKLANFPDIEAFVLVACPECTVLDSKEFFQSIVTPYELELALNKGRDWKGDYLLDFRLLIPGGRRYATLECSEVADVSLISGGMRVMTNWKGLDAEEQGESRVFEGRSGTAHRYEDEPVENDASKKKYLKILVLKPRKHNPFVT